MMRRKALSSTGRREPNRFRGVRNTGGRLTAAGGPASGVLDLTGPDSREKIAAADAPAPSRPCPTAARAVTRNGQPPREGTREEWKGGVKAGNVRRLAGAPGYRGAPNSCAGPQARHAGPAPARRVRGCAFRRTPSPLPSPRRATGRAAVTGGHSHRMLCRCPSLRPCPWPQRRGALHPQRCTWFARAKGP